MRTFISLWTILLLPTCCVCGDEKDIYIAAPITYEEAVLIVRNKDGVAAIQFGKEMINDAETNENGQRIERRHREVSYKFRYLPRTGGQELKGSGVVREKAELRTEPGLVGRKIIDKGSILYVEAVSIQLMWSYRLSGKGFVYYYPEKMVVQMMTPRQFESIKLKRFLSDPNDPD